MSDTIEEPRIENKKAKASSILPLVILMLLFSAAGGLFGAWSYRHMTTTTQTQVEKIVVLRASDYLSRENSAGKFNAGAANKAISEMKADAKTLASRGYIVLDESAIIEASPDKIFSKTD